MSHDLRTPLNAIIGFLQVITNQLFGPIGNTRYTEYLDLMTIGANNLVDMIDEILDLSRLEAEGFPVRAEVYEPVRRTRLLIDSMRALFDHRTVSVHLIDDRAPRTICADPSMDTKIQQNLLSNALRHCDPGTAIRVEWALEDDAVVLSVRNRGPRFPKAVLDGLGSPFIVSNPRTTSATGKSHGLGLYICKRYVEARGGELRLINHPDGPEVRAIWNAEAIEATR